MLILLMRSPTGHYNRLCWLINAIYNRRFNIYTKHHFWCDFNYSLNYPFLPHSISLILRSLKTTYILPFRLWLTSCSPYSNRKKYLSRWFIKWNKSRKFKTFQFVIETSFIIFILFYRIALPKCYPLSQASRPLLVCWALGAPPII